LLKINPAYCVPAAWLAGAAGIFMSGDPNESIAVFDLQPADGAAPAEFQAIRSYAEQLIANFPDRYRIPLPGEQLPTERADGKPINPDAGT
jgi:hypothetical protein